MTNADLASLAPCSHEEADTRLFIHAGDAARKGHRKLCIRTVDTDVAVLAIAMFNQINLDELWLAFGTKAHFRYIPIHDVVNEINPVVCKSLLFFHAFTCCDTVSAFGGRGKKTAWNTWKVFPDVNKAFEDLLLMRDNNISQSSMSLLEQFVVLLYDRTSDLVKVNDARKWLYSHKGLGVWKTYHQHRQHLHNILNVQVTKLTVGTWQCVLFLSFQIQKTGAGGKMTEGGIHFGLPFQKHQNLAVN